MKLLTRIYLICLFLLSGSIIGVLITPAPNPEHLSQFIKGRWEGQFFSNVDNEDMVERYQLVFLDSEVIINRETRDVNHYNLVYQYEFINTNVLKVRGRMERAEWQITRRGEMLSISTEGAIIQSGDYIRKPSIPWTLISLLFGLVLLGLYIWYFRSRIRTSKQGTIGAHSLSFQKRYWEILRFLFNTLLFYGGFSIMHRIILPLSPVREIQLPWDGVMAFEIGLLLLLLGLIIRQPDFAKEKDSGSISKGLIRSIGYFILGSGSFAIFLGLLEITLFFRFGDYVQ